jgi:putative toxin-antitoxin system antitoxin component (TIGR02293 family)
MLRPGDIANVMGGQAVLGRAVRSLAELDKIVADGLPKKALRATAERVASLPADTRRVVYLIVPEATYKRRAKLSRLESERTERLARVIAAAEFVWSDRAPAREWLMRPHSELNSRTPFETAITELGARRVEELLDRLFYGVPA